MKLLLVPAAMMVAAAWACFPQQTRTAAAPTQASQARSQPAQPQTTPSTQPSRPGIFNPPPQTRPGLAYDEPFFPGATYDATVPTPASVVGEEIGTAQRPASPAEIVSCLLAWQNHPRVKLVHIGETHERRPLYEVIVTSEANHQRLDEIQAGWKKLGDPRGVDDAEARRLRDSLPPVAWLGYSIHGNETSGADAAVQVLYHLIAGTDAETTRLLEDLVIIIDPALNPDGRERFVHQQRTARTRAPVVDDQDNQVVGDLPHGRTNHYMFDLNRDWIYATQPETQARIRFLRDWHPLLMVDAHEMSSQDTYLFGPGRQPINPHIPETRTRLRRLFGDEQGAAFSERGWRYYSGEWAEEWYPGYTDSWGTYRGAAGVLYEQSHRGAIGVARPEGFVATHRHGVHQQAASSLANLRTLQRHRDRIANEFADEKARNVSADGPYAARVFVFVPRGNTGREAQLAELLKLQGFEAYVADAPIELAGAVDRMGNELEGKTVPAGSLLVPNRQPQAQHIAAVMEFDTRFSSEFLKLERRSLLRGEGGMVYDITAWAMPFFFDIEAYEARMEMPAGARRLADDEAWPSPAAGAAAAGVDRRDAKVAYVIDGRDDRSVAAAGRLMERGVEVKLARRPFKFGGRQFRRGSIIVSLEDNQMFEGDFVGIVDEVARGLGVAATAVDIGTGDALPTDEPDPVDFGGGFFRRLEPPRIALFTRGAGGNYTAGEAWHTIDHRLGLRATYLNTNFGSFSDLRRYNVIILPDLPRREVEQMREALDAWVRAGGTLIAIGSSAAALAVEEKGLGGVRQLEDVLAKLNEYEQAVLRELAAQGVEIDEDSVFARGVAGEIEYPWDADASRAGEDELKRRDAWQRIFSPIGVELAGRVDERHWLTSGIEGPLPLLVTGGTVLMAGEGVEAPVRFGVLSEGHEGTKARRQKGEDGQTTEPASVPARDAATEPATSPVGAPASSRAAGDDEGKEKATASWVRLPEGTDVTLRMSGLLWPEYSARIAHAPYMTRQGHGSGQIILFADSPNFRAATLGTMRLFTNAVVYGPGCGANAPIMP